MTQPARPDLRDLVAALTTTPAFRERFEYRSLLGEGGMGVVLLAHDGRLQRDVAIKCIRRELLGDDACVGRFRREAAVLARLDHPSVVKVYDTGEVDLEAVFLVSEYVRGPSLRARFRSGVVPFADAVEAALGVADALAYVHGRGIVHRDVKPENVLLPPEGGVKVIDFGLARRFDDTGSGDALTRAGVVVGTPAYMAPEAIMGQPLSPVSDVYSLGAVFFEALLGRVPYPGSPMDIVNAHIERRPPDFSGLPRGLPTGLDEFLRSALAGQQDLRARSMDEFAERLRRLAEAGALRPLAEAPTRAAPSAEAPPRGRRPRRPRPGEGSMAEPPVAPLRAPGARPWALGGAALGLAALLGLAATLAPPGPGRPSTGFLTPPGLMLLPGRGALRLTWTSAGDCATVEAVPAEGGGEAQVATAGPDGAALERLVPGRRYRLRLLAADGRAGPSQTISASYSPLALAGVDAPTRYDGPAAARFTTVGPQRLEARWRQGTRDLRDALSGEASRDHQLAYVPADGPFTGLDLWPLGGTGQVPWPVDQLAREADAALRALDPAALRPLLVGALKPLPGLRLTEQERQARARAALGTQPRFLRFLAVAPFLPTVLADDALPSPVRADLAASLLRLLPLEKLAHTEWAGSVVPVEALLGPEFGLRREEVAGAPATSLTSWPLRGGSFAPASLRGTSSLARIVAARKLLYEGEALLFGAESTFHVEPAELAAARRAELLLEGHLFAPTYVVRVRLNSAPELPFHHPWGRFDPSRVGREGVDAIQVVTLVRPFPTSSLLPGENRLTVDVDAPLGTCDELVPQLRRIALRLVPR